MLPTVLQPPSSKPPRIQSFFLPHQSRKQISSLFKLQDLVLQIGIFVKQLKHLNGGRYDPVGSERKGRAEIIAYLKEIGVFQMEF